MTRIRTVVETGMTDSTTRARISDGIDITRSTSRDSA
jgi:hypothetical protein